MTTKHPARQKQLCMEGDCKFPLTPLTILEISTSRKTTFPSQDVRASPGILSMDTLLAATSEQEWIKFKQNKTKKIPSRKYEPIRLLFWKQIAFLYLVRNDYAGPSNAFIKRTLHCYYVVLLLLTSVGYIENKLYSIINYIYTHLRTIF